MGPSCVQQALAQAETFKVFRFGKHCWPPFLPDLSCRALLNEVLMIKRSGRDAVLHFLYDGKARKHGNQVLWESWQFLEEIRDQDQDVTEQQTRTRLEVFPMSKEEQEYDSD